MPSTTSVEISTVDGHQRDASHSPGLLSFSAVAPVDVQIRRSKSLLTQIDADFPQASLTGIIGSSGSGKTTLLNVLSRRMHSSNPATDILLPTLTVRETLMYAADLRLPASITRVKRARLVEEIRTEGMCQHSGLDAFTAASTMDVLRQLAEEGRTIVTTLHQSSSELFKHFGNVLLLTKGGRVAYSGPDMLDYMTSVGFKCPAIPTFTGDLSYVNNALVRPIVAFMK
ncbi:hypothetical protein EDD85DRAFT_945213 [Armillaria nabsnona]|nr:hypothetical protein EDD85DRAFT_945213 [Armillaria nabsnona]